MEETVTIGDTEIRIEETDDGFEAVEVGDDEPESETGLWLRAEDSGARYGCEIPLEADFTLVDSRREYKIAWKTDDDRSEMKSDGNSSFDFDSTKFDGHALVRNISLVRD